MGCKVIAHRGANTRAPQNTIPAFAKAIEEHANGFETDVHLTKDGIPVICHNYAIDDTSDGKGKIADYTYEELKKFDFGSYFSKEYAGTRIPTLDEFLDFVGPSDTEIINIELKYPTSGLHELCQKTLDAVKAHGVLERVIISSFSPKVLAEIKKIEPECKTAFLYPSSRPDVARMQFNPFITVKKIHADIIHPMALILKKSVVDKAHKLGLKVNVWTVNDRATVNKLLGMGVDGLITDCPAEIRVFVDQYENKNKKNNKEI